VTEASDFGPEQNAQLPFERFLNLANFWLTTGPRRANTTSNGIQGNPISLAPKVAGTAAGYPSSVSCSQEIGS